MRYAGRAAKRRFGVGPGVLLAQRSQSEEAEPTSMG